MGKELTLKTAKAYLSGEGNKAIIVLHEWWGLVPHIKDITDRFAKEGFLAIAPDLYDGKTADNPNDAGALMQHLFSDLSKAEEIIKETIDYLKSQGAKKIGITGFCCGGTLTWYFGKYADALVPFYALYQLAPIDFSSIKAPVLAIHAEKDEFVPLSDVEKAKEECKKHGIKAEFIVYPGVNHAFLNDTRPEVYNEKAAKDAWEKAVNFFKKHLS